MKYFLALLILSICLLQFNCKTYPQKSGINALPVADTICSSSSYLSVRMPNCLNAMIWMDSIVLPTEVVIVSNSANNLPKIVEGNFNIAGDTLSKFLTNNHLYYINNDCFVGKSCRNVFRVFCPDKMYSSLASVDSLNQISNTRWKISFVHNGEIGLSFDCFNGEVTSSKFSKASIKQE